MDGIPHPSNWQLEALNIGRRARDGQRWLLEDVSLEVDPGDRIALSGPSGSGKTLLLRALALLDPLDTGIVRWRGEPVRHEAVPAFRSQILYLSQRPVLFEGSVEANLRLPFDLGIHRHRRFDLERARDLLGRLGRDDAFLSRSSRDLSGGEAQLVALARALELDPSVLLLDEPTASLDAANIGSAEEQIDRWVSEDPDGRAFVWVSHDPDQAMRTANRRLRLRAGRLEPEA